jgi:hypothetical protein
MDCYDFFESIGANFIMYIYEYAVFYVFLIFWFFAEFKKKKKKKKNHGYSACIDPNIGYILWNYHQSLALILAHPMVPFSMYLSLNWSRRLPQSAGLAPRVPDFLRKTHALLSSGAHRAAVSWTAGGGSFVVVNRWVAVAKWQFGLVGQWQWLFAVVLVFKSASGSENWPRYGLFHFFFLEIGDQKKKSLLIIRGVVCGRQSVGCSGCGCGGWQCGWVAVENAVVLVFQWALEDKNWSSLINWLLTFSSKINI